MKTITRGLLTFVAALLAVPVYAQTMAREYSLEIERQPLAAALTELSKQTGLQIGYFPETFTETIRIGPLKGRYTAEAAIAQLLLHSGLSFERLNERTIAVTGPASTRPQRRVFSTTERRLDGVTEPSFVRLANLRLAAGPAAEGGDQQITAAANMRGRDEGKRKQRGVIEEIFVTAQKREERLIDVPQSVTVLSADELAKQGAIQLRDYANTVPGLSFQTGGAGLNTLSLRGVSIGPTANQTVAIYVDDAPYGAGNRGGQMALDLPPFDIERIEVLRGPQGTLYGAASFSGLLKYVTKKPETTGFGGQAQAGISSTEDGGVNFNTAAVVNVPLAAEKLALRVSGYQSRDDGYVDNLALGKENVNRSDVYGGRVDLLFTPTEALSFRLSGAVQEISREGFATADFLVTGPPVDDRLEQRRFVSEPFDQRFRLASGTVTYDFDKASLISISSYLKTETEFTIDWTPGFAPFLQSIGFPISAVGIFEDDSVNKFTQEIRLVSKGTQTLDWLIGGFYTRETPEQYVTLISRDLAGQPTDLEIYATDSKDGTRVEEYAGFGNLTWHLTDRFDMTGGIRFSHHRARDGGLESSGELLGGASVSPIIEGTDDVVNYLANVRYRFNSHSTGYLRYATAYVAGSPPSGLRHPVTSEPIPGVKGERLTSYEVGYRAETDGGRFGVDVAGYYNDWDNFATVVLDEYGYGVRTNAAKGATIKGAELALTARSTGAFTARGAFAYQDAEVAADNPELGAVEGDRLPNVPRFTATLSVDYELLVGNFEPTIGATLVHVGDRISTFSNSNGRTPYDMSAYTTADVRAGLTLGSVDMQFYVRNVFDKRGQMMAPQAVTPPSGPAWLSMVQPRTIGVVMSRAF